MYSTPAKYDTFIDYTIKYYCIQLRALSTQYSVHATCVLTYYKIQHTSSPANHAHVPSCSFSMYTRLLGQDHSGTAYSYTRYTRRFIAALRGLSGMHTVVHTTHNELLSTNQVFNWIQSDSHRSQSRSGPCKTYSDPPS